MEHWDGWPLAAHRGETKLHVIASALGRNPTPFQWNPAEEVWTDVDKIRTITPSQMREQKLTYIGWVEQALPSDD